MNMLAADLIASLRAEIETVFREMDSRFDAEGPGRRACPDGEPWCADEILEHVMLANRYLLILIEKGAGRAERKYRRQPHDLPALLSSYELTNDRFETIGINDSFEWAVPAHMVPSGNVEMDVVRDLLRGQHRALLAVLDRIPNGEGVLALTHMSVLKLGRIDVYQYIHFMVLHMRRHLQQIESLKE